VIMAAIMVEIAALVALEREGRRQKAEGRG
jgi:hypothetical protein